MLDGGAGVNVLTDSLTAAPLSPSTTLKSLVDWQGRARLGLAVAAGTQGLPGGARPWVRDWVEDFEEDLALGPNAELSITI
ncbi:MAG: hypothetical protein HY510_05440 [Acidobacteria bacterium]|nr:hypothetical protein [Acidobacteriota bacterium]